MMSMRISILVLVAVLAVMIAIGSHIECDGSPEHLERVVYGGLYGP